MTDNLLGQQLDEYRLDALLGQGGMARVYRGLDVRLKRWVAIKVIDAPFRTDSDYMRRFEREAQAIAQLEHPHIIRLYRYGEANGLLYMAMQYVEGTTLDRVLGGYQKAGEFIEPGKANRIVREICLALDYAHHKGVIHRDVKPANILLDKEGRAILTDFGLALLADVGTQGEIFGTPHYIAPEQAISSAGVVPQSDLYAVGVILYEMFTGELPFDAEQPLDIAMLHMSEPPRPPRGLRPDLNVKLEAVILKALSKEPEERYPSGSALAKALDQAFKVAPVRTPSALFPASHPSTLEQTQLEVEARPLPPLPAAVRMSPPQQINPPLSVAPTASLSSSISSSSPVTAPASKRSIIYAGIGIGLAGGLVLIVLLAALFLLPSGAGEDKEMIAAQLPTTEIVPAVLRNEEVQEEESSSLIKEIPTETPVLTPSLAPAETATAMLSLETPVLTPSPVPAETATVAPSLTPTDVPPTLTPVPPTSTPLPTPTATIQPTETAVPTTTPTATPSPAATATPAAPQPVADTQIQFSGSQGVQNWHYQWSIDRESFNWTDMRFDGSCWRTTNSENFVRICQNSAHPGETGDIAWRWTSNVTGQIYVWVSASKIDTGGGDGVKIIVYRGLEPIKSWQLDGNDGVGFKEGFTMDISEGDFLFFVMKIGSGSNNDETYFRVQIYP